MAEKTDRITEPLADDKVYKYTLVRGDESNLSDLEDRLADFHSRGYDFVAITPYATKEIPGDQSRPFAERGFVSFSQVRWYLCIFKKRA